MIGAQEEVEYFSVDPDGRFAYTESLGPRWRSASGSDPGVSPPVKKNPKIRGQTRRKKPCCPSGKRIDCFAGQPS